MHGPAEDARGLALGDEVARAEVATAKVGKMAYWGSSSAISRASAIDEVAAGEGALRT